MPYYLFEQNNSGGSFIYDPERGLTARVYVEGDDYSEANARALDIGLYFDGYGDCSCCGQRWHEAGDWSDPETPPKPEAPFKIDELADYVHRKWMDDDQYEAFVHPKNGPFYGAFKEVVYTRKLTYDGTCGYGVRVWNHKVEGEPYGPYAVNEKGWSEDGNRWAPYPDQIWGWREQERHRMIQPASDVAVLPDESGDYAAFWFASEETAERFVELCNAYLDVTPRPKLVDWAVKSIQS